MKKGLIISLAAAVIALSAISCSKSEEVISYNNITMGNIEAGIFTSDQGNIFNVTEQTCPGKLDTMKRAFIICDILNKTAGLQDEYDIRVNYIADVLEKEAVPVSDIPNLETYMNDPLILTNAWTSGGYINFFLTVPVKRGSKKEHEINLLHEYRDGAYIFRLCHNANGEIITDNSGNTLVMATAYVSFPITSIIREDEAKVTLEWNSYITEGNQITAETRQFSETQDYTKSEFEHNIR